MQDIQACAIPDEGESLSWTPCLQLDWSDTSRMSHPPSDGHVQVGASEHRHTPLKFLLVQTVQCWSMKCSNTKSDVSSHLCKAQNEHNTKGNNERARHDIPYGPKKCVPFKWIWISYITSDTMKCSNTKSDVSSHLCKAQNEHNTKGNNERARHDSQKFRIF